jgi:hypothetical protein
MRQATSAPNAISQLPDLGLWDSGFAWRRFESMVPAAFGLLEGSAGVSLVFVYLSKSGEKVNIEME